MNQPKLCQFVGTELSDDNKRVSMNFDIEGEDQSISLSIADLDLLMVTLLNAGFLAEQRESRSGPRSHTESPVISKRHILTVDEFRVMISPSRPDAVLFHFRAERGLVLTLQFDLNLARGAGEALQQQAGPEIPSSPEIH